MADGLSQSPDLAEWLNPVILSGFGGQMKLF